MGVFSRYLWLRVLRDRSGKDVAKTLKGIYMEHGAPRPRSWVKAIRVQNLNVL